MMRALSVTALYVLLLFQISSATQELDSESFEALMDSGKALSYDSSMTCVESDVRS